MATGASKERWTHTAHLLTLLANCHRGKNTSPIKFEDVYPYRDREKADASPEFEAAEAERFFSDLRRGFVGE